MNLQPLFTMITRIVWGATASTALHAFVLFGLDWPHSPPVQKPVEPPSVIEWIAPPPLEEKPEEIEIAHVESAPKGRPDVSRPTSEEFLREARGPFVFQPVVHRVVPPKPFDDRISAEMPGVPGGIDGPGSDLPVLPRDMLDNEPRTRTRVAPQYPTQARSLGLTGEVIVEFVVDENGHVRNPRVVRSSDTVFEAATLRAVERWRFEPGKKNGKPVRFRMAVPVVFNLEV